MDIQIGKTAANSALGLNRVLSAGLLAAVLCAPVSAATTLLAPGTSYTSFADSPFAPLDFLAGYFHLEDFEDAALNTPGVTSTSGGFGIGASDFTDSVDGDDGNIDGSGLAGGSFFSGYPGGTATFTFEFDAAILGALPTHVGIVWTDVGFASPSDFFGDVSFEAFDANAASLGSIGPSAVGDGFATGQTAEDRFFGIIADDGVARIVMTMAGSSDDWEVDHLQYGRLTPVPVPMAGVLLLSGVLGLTTRVRRRG